MKIVKQLRTKNKKLTKFDDVDESVLILFWDILSILSG